MLITLFNHPWLALAAMLIAALLAERIWIATAGAIAVALRGPYLGEPLSKLDRVGFFLTAAALLCLPVIVWRI